MIGSRDRLCERSHGIVADSVALGSVSDQDDIGAFPESNKANGFSQNRAIHITAASWFHCPLPGGKSTPLKV